MRKFPEGHMTRRRFGAAALSALALAGLSGTALAEERPGFFTRLWNWLFGKGEQPVEEKKKPGYYPRRLLEKNTLLPDMALGKADAPITIYEYASATCPHCADFHTNEWPLIRKEYVDTGKVRFVFREFPLDQVALAAFMLARCASGNDTKKYHALLDTIFKTQRDWAKNPREGLLKIMRMAGMDEQRFDACQKDRKLAQAIINSARNASRDFEVASTPTFFINGRKVEGRRTIEEFRKIIDAELKRAQAKAEDKAQ